MFWPDETVELSAAAMETEDLFHLWDLLDPASYELSVPCQARGLRIESTRELAEHPAVRERKLVLGSVH